MAADFSELSRDVLGLVLSKLSTPDYTRFGAVCRRWRHAFLERDHPPAPGTPWLIVAGHDKRTMKFLSLSETNKDLSLSETNKVCEIRQPDPMIRRRLYIGSSDGWLFTVSNNTLAMHLLNPITGVQILLPSITTFPFVEAVCDSKGRISKYVINEEGKHPYSQSLDNLCNSFFKKAVTFKTARNMKDGFIVMLIHEPGNKLSFTQRGDDTWTTLNARQGLRDVIRHKGQIYTVAYNGVIDVWDPDGQSFKPRTITGEQDVVGYRVYLVESITGDLLMVRRGKVPLKVFKVLKLDESTGEWDELNDLGDQALFVGNNRSMALSVREHSELKRSCIYFTDDTLWSSPLSRRSRLWFPELRRCYYRYRDVGMCNLADNITEYFFLLPSYRWPPPIWFTPSLS